MLNTDQILVEICKLKIEYNIVPKSACFAHPFKPEELAKRFQCTTDELRLLEEGKLCNGQIRPHIVYDKYSGRYFIAPKPVEELSTFDPKIASRSLPYILVLCPFLLLLNGGPFIILILLVWLFGAQSAEKNKKANEVRRARVYNNCI